MEKILICSSFYEAGAPFLKQFFAGVVNSADNSSREVCLLIAVDDFQDIKGVIQRYKDDVDIMVSQANERETISDVRSRMVRSAIQSNFDILIFLDMDDFLLEDGINYHLEALSDADISYGDLQLVDSDGHPIGKTLFTNIGVPNTVVSADMIREGNFFGFSNTAVKRASLDGIDIQIPSNLIASDWWFFSNLLSNGLIAKKTAGTVAAYRQHNANTLGADEATSLEQIQFRCKAALDHFEQLPVAPANSVIVEKLKFLSEVLSMRPHEIDLFGFKTYPRNHVWFSDVFCLANLVRKEKFDKKVNTKIGNQADG